MSKKTKKNKKIILIFIIFITICAGTFFALTYLPKTTNLSEITSESSTKKSTDISTKTVENSSENNEKKEEIEGKPQIVQNDGEDPNQREELTGILTASHVSENKLILRVNIDQFLTSGKCVLKLSSGANAVEKEANIISSASTSTCEGFDVSMNELGSGKWSIEIFLDSNNKTGKITGEVDI